MTNMTANELTNAVRDAAFDDVVWAATVRQLGALRVVTIAKSIHDDIGQQISQRNASLAISRDAPEIDDAEFAVIKERHHAWMRSVGTIRRCLAKRIKETQPLAQRVIDDHHADRTTMLRLAKRIWLWERGETHDLEDALDDLTGSMGDERVPLRQIVLAMVANGGAKTP